MSAEDKDQGPRKRRWWRILLIGLLAVGLLWTLRAPLLRGIGQLLIVEDDPRHADVAYALGGSSLDRGRELAVLLQRGVAPIGVTTGSNLSNALEAYGLEVTEASLTATVARRAGAPSLRIDTLVMGTSTWEEAAAVLDDARRRGADTIVVITTEFHTRRVKRVFRKRFEGSGITVLVHGAHASDYEPERWWTTEEGLIMVNNEYMKLLYYAITY